MTTSHCFGCFWVHIKWNRKLTAGIDQQGRVWEDFTKPKPVGLPWLIPVFEMMTDSISSMAKLKI